MAIEQISAKKTLRSEQPLDEITQTQLALAELAEAQAAAQTENELALAELAELLVGGES